MKEYKWLLDKYRRSGVLVDTNILLAYFVGTFDRALIPKFKRTSAFTVEDYETIVAVLEFFEIRVTTPNILTEVSNLTGHLKDDRRGDYMNTFALGMTLLKEYYTPSQELSEKSVFKKFGLTDASIMTLAKDKYLVFTDDLPLYHYLANNGIDALNFNHIRMYNWQ